jgi:hypothetical protein
MVAFASVLEAQAELHLACRAGAYRGGGERRSNLSEGSACGSGPARTRAADVGNVKQVEYIGPEAQAHAFTQGESLLHRAVDLPKARSTNRIPWKISPSIIRGHGQGGRVVPESRPVQAGAGSIDVMNRLSGREVGAQTTVDSIW